MKKIYVEMIADLFHYGHVEFLCKARALGDHLTVGVLSDEWSKKYKKEPVMTWQERARVVEACRHVDEILLQAEPASNEWLRKNNYITAIAMKNETDKARHLATSIGYDRTREIELPYEHGISTTDIIQRIEARERTHQKDLAKTRKFFGRRWGAGEWLLAEQMLQDIGGLLKKNDIPYFLAFGSYLGAVRHGGVIPWDDDIDIAIREQDEAHLSSLIPALKECGYNLVRYTVTTGPYTEIYYKIWIEKKRSGTDKLHSWPFIDIFVLRPSANDSAQCGLDHRFFPVSQVFPLAQTAFGSLTLPVPNDPALLETLYDAEYMTRCFSTSYIHRDEKLAPKTISRPAAKVKEAGCFVDISSTAQNLRHSIPVHTHGWQLNTAAGQLVRDQVSLQADTIMIALWDKIDGQRSVEELFSVFGGPRIERMRAVLDTLNILQKHNSISIASNA